MWNLEKWQRPAYWQSRNRVTEREGKCMATGRGRGMGGVPRLGWMHMLLTLCG